jgi:AMP phosphorylase
MGGKAKEGYGKKLAREILESGKAYKQMQDIIHAQGGKIPEFKLAKYSWDVISERSGKIHEISNNLVSKIARIAGAPEDCRAGMYLYFKVGDEIKKGDMILTIYSDSDEKLKFTKEFYKNSKGIIIK